MRVRRRLAIALVLPALAGCGGDDPPRQAGPAPVYPPRAAEPATSPKPAAKPAGRVVRVGGKPEGVAFDAETGLVAVGVSEPPSLALLDRDGTLRKRVPLPGPPRHLQLAAPGGPVLVPAEPADELVEVSLPGGGKRVTRVGDQPHDAAGLGGRVFVGDEFSSTLTALQDGRVVGDATVDAQPGGVVAAGGKIGVISVLAYTIELFDPRTLKGEGSRNAGIGPTHAVADAAGRIYITDTRGDAVIVYATQPRLKWVGRIELPGSPYGIAADPTGDRVWVTLTARNEVVELRGGDQPERLRSFPTVRQPNTVAVEPGSRRVFVASRTDGTLQLITP